MKKILLAIAISMLMIGCDEKRYKSIPDEYPMICYQSSQFPTECFCCNGDDNTEYGNQSGKKCYSAQAAAFSFTKCEVAESFGFKILKKHPRVTNWEK